MTIGERIRQIRKEKKIKQVDLAKAVGLTVNGLQQIEYGQIQPRLSTIKKIAKALDVYVCDIDEELIVNKPLCEYTTKELLEEIERRVNIHGF